MADLLLIEDDEAQRFVARFALKKAGHDVREAADGEHALSVLDSAMFDVAFIDIGLPGITGYQVAQRLRADANVHASLLLVALTGWGAEEDRRHAQAAGFDVHLVKPVDFDKLNEVLATHALAAQRTLQKQ